jgi:hypothetical protein
MLISRFFQNFFRFFSLIQSEDRLPYQACPQQGWLLPVSSQSILPQSNVDWMAVYATRIANLNSPLRLLIENEIFRLSVWGNPTHDSRKSPDLVGTTERTLADVSHSIRHSIIWLSMRPGLLDCDPPHNLAHKSSYCHLSDGPIQTTSYSLWNWKICSVEYDRCTRCTRSSFILAWRSARHQCPQRFEGSIFLTFNGIDHWLRLASYFMGTRISSRRNYTLWTTIQ